MIQDRLPHHPVTGRRLWAALDLLDRQLRTRDGGLCGKVDDLELRRDEETGALYVAAILSGPGRLLGRFGRRRSGNWLVRFAAQNAVSRSGAETDDADPTRIPFAYVQHIAASIDLALDAHQVGSDVTERWFRDHVISHIPGSRHEAE